MHQVVGTQRLAGHNHVCGGGRGRHPHELVVGLMFVVVVVRLLLHVAVHRLRTMSKVDEQPFDLSANTVIFSTPVGSRLGHCSNKHVKTCPVYKKNSLAL